jgi:hypothetical protein
VSVFLNVFAQPHAHLLASFGAGNSQGMRFMRGGDPANVRQLSVIGLRVYRGVEQFFRQEGELPVKDPAMDVDAVVQLVVGEVDLSTGASFLAYIVKDAGAVMEDLAGGLKRIARLEGAVGLRARVTFRFAALPYRNLLSSARAPL